MDHSDQIAALIEERVEGDTTREEDIFFHLLKVSKLIHESTDVEERDWKTYLMKRIRERMELGRSRYGHGIRIEDDTRRWGTKRDSWLEMCEEEILDGLMYTGADILRKV